MMKIILRLVIFLFPISMFGDPVDAGGFSKPDTGKIGKLGRDVLRVEGRVSQVFDGGFLLFEWRNLTLEPFVDRKGIFHDGATVMTTSIAIAEVGSDFADGDMFRGVVYPAGRLKYESMAGVRTVYLYGTTPELARKLLDTDDRMTSDNPRF
jgi:hypothetical protein